MTQQRDVWSLSAGRWWGVQIRIHLFFLLFATLTCYLAWQLAQQQPQIASSPVTAAAVCLMLLLVSVLFHELAHSWCATRLGGHVDTLVLGPLGGLHPVRMANDPQSELLATLAGPVASLGAAAVFFTIAAVTAEDNVLRILHPLSPALVAASETGLPVWHWHSLVRLSCWINWVLVLVNLLPVFPFDGGRVCLGVLRAVRPDRDAHRLTAAVALLAKLLAVALLIAAWFFRDMQPVAVAPAWLGLVLLAIFVFFSARMEEMQSEPQDVEGDLFGYDFSQGFTSLERSTRDHTERPGPITSWWQRMKRRRLIRQRALEADDERRLDDILGRLHKYGYDRLTIAEKSLLRRVSARYRSRERSPDQRL